MARDPQSLFNKGIELFNRCEFYNCHEVLEELWTGTHQPERWFLQSLIHFAEGFHHHQHNNAFGAARQLAKRLRKIQAYLPEWGGVQTAGIAREVRRCLAIIEAGGKIENFPNVEQFAPYRPEQSCRTSEHATGHRRSGWRGIC